MQNLTPNVYCYVNNYNLSDLSKLGRNINIIYRNYESIDHLEDLLKLKQFCKKNGNDLYLTNDLKLSIKLRLTGVYIPSFNKKLNISGSFSLPKNFKIIGSAHNIKEIKIKINQGCELIFLSPIFKTNKNNSYLGVVKFNLVKLNQKSSFVALGGINDFNYKKIYLTKPIGIAGIKWVKKNGPRNILRPFL